LAEGLKELNSLSFERLDNEMKYEEYMKLLDIHHALRFEAPANTQGIQNAGLIEGIQG
jgi:hypothetical protein